MTTEFTWKWSNQLFVFPKYIQIFKDNILVGVIPSLKPNKSTATINGRNFLITETNPFIGTKTFMNAFLETKTFIIEPESRKPLAEIKCYDRQIILEINEKCKYDLSIGTDDNPAQSNNLVVQLYKDRMFFANSGRIAIRSNENIEILLLSTFYAYYLRKTENNNA